MLLERMLSMLRPSVRAVLRGVPFAAVGLVIGMLSAVPSQAQELKFVEASVRVAEGTPAGGVSVGVALSPRYNVRVELEVVGRDVARDRFVAAIVRSEFENATQPTSVSLLIARRFRSERRVQLEFLAGLGFVRTRWESSGYLDLLTTGTVTNHAEWDDRGTTTAALWTVGFDVVLDLTKRVCLVPQWRGRSSEAQSHGLLGDFSLPANTFHHGTGASLRWRF